MKRAIWIGIGAVVMLGGIAIIRVGYDPTPSDKCLKLSKEQIISLARQQKYSLLENGDARKSLTEAEMVQFIDWHDPKFGYSVAFDAPTPFGRYLIVQISGACAMRQSRTNDLPPPI